MIVRHLLLSGKSVLKGMIGEFVVIDYLRCNSFEIQEIAWARLSASGPIVSLKSIFRGGAAQKPYDIVTVKNGKRYLIEVKFGQSAKPERNQLENLRALAGTINADGTVNVPVIARVKGSFENGNDSWEIDWQEVSPRVSSAIGGTVREA